MILRNIRDYLRQHQRVALRDMALHFNMDENALRGMLTQWERKGKLRKLPSGATCGGGCSACSPETIELYEWNEEGDA
jgi:DeoR/GlpR family transcriptional regulator of sugar metabolism